MIKKFDKAKLFDKDGKFLYQILSIDCVGQDRTTVQFELIFDKDGTLFKTFLDVPYEYADILEYKEKVLPECFDHIVTCRKVVPVKEMVIRYVESE